MGAWSVLLLYSLRGVAPRSPELACLAPSGLRDRSRQITAETLLFTGGEVPELLESFHYIGEDDEDHAGYSGEYPREDLDDPRREVRQALEEPESDEDD